MLCSWHARHHVDTPFVRCVWCVCILCAHAGRCECRRRVIPVVLAQGANVHAPWCGARCGVARVYMSACVGAVCLQACVCLRVCVCGVCRVVAGLSVGVWPYTEVAA